jgi:PAS domain S-box-containing protein
MQSIQNKEIKVLIAEDSRTQAEQLRFLLEEQGYGVTAAANGKEALAAAQAQKPSLLISDVVMPEMDGYDLCRAIKTDERLKDIPVILLTSLSDPRDVIRGLECGADNFIRKPYDERYLLSRIEYSMMNLELRKDQKTQFGLQIDLGGRRHFITAERQQILDLLISTYEQAVCVNIELIQREKELAQSNQTLNALYRISEGLNRVSSEREVAETALNLALKLPGVRAGCIWLREGSSFRLAAARDLPPTPAKRNAFEGSCACHRKLLTGELDKVVNIRECERLVEAKGRTAGLRGHASVPLWLGEGGALGVMNLAKPEGGLFDEEELKVLFVVGNQVAVALERARLQEHLERLVEERTAKLTAEVAERIRVQEEQARLVAILEATPDLVSTMTPDGQLLYINQAGLSMLGWEKNQDVSTLRIRDAHPEWACKRVLEEGIPYAVNHGCWSGETALLGRDGREISIQQLIIAHRNNDGSLQYLSKIGRDITLRKATEERLRQSETALRIAGNLARLGGWVANLSGSRALSWSDEVCAIHEVAPGTSPTIEEWIRCYAPECREKIKEVFDACIRNGDSFDEELQILTANGGRVWVRVIGQAVRDGGGAITQVQGALQNITEKKRAEAEVSRLAARLTTTLESITDAFFTLDRDWRFTYLNRETERLWQTTRADLLGKVIWDEFKETIGGAFDHRFRQAVRENCSVAFEEYYAPLGLWLEVRAYPSEEGLAVYFCDVTKRRRDQEALQQLNDHLEARVAARTVDMERARFDAEQANRAKSDFLAAMSHEIRTPLNGVIGMIDVLQQSSLRGYQVEIANLIHESAFSLLDIINDILDFSKIEADKLEIERTPMSAADVVANVCDMLDHLAERKGVELTLFIDPRIPDEVLGDAVRLRQVLVNLVNNAIKFSSGQVDPGRVSVRAILAATGVERVTMEFRIEDNGIGMDSDTQARLFSPFTQADASTTRRFGGTGLGLVISHHLVTMMGGNIAVQSVPGKGSVFTVRLPFATAPAKPASREAASEVEELSCLVVGGAEGLAADLSAYLASANAAVERAPDLSAARERAGNLPPGLWVWIIDTAGAPPQPDELRAAARVRPGLDTRFVVIERGRRRWPPRVQAADLVSVDRNVLKCSTLLRAVATAAGRGDMEEEVPLPGKRDAEFSPPSREEARRQGRLILIAEDNQINQRVILQQLALLGFTADIAGDGHEALKRWESGDYALLLTDLHMPTMDGYDLTVAIRAEEAGERRMPIIAFTANAIKGEADRCQAVGMDDYITKPVQLVQLKALLEKWLPAAAPSLSHSAQPAPEAASSGSVVDVSVLKTMVGDDPAVIDEFLRDFRTSAATAAAELRAACRSGQAKKAGAAAHKLKSAARSVGALALGELCAELDQAGSAGQIEAVSALLPRFEQEMAAVEACLAERRGEFRGETMPRGKPW